METLAATLAIYRRAFTRAGAAVAKNWPVAGTVFLYFWTFGFAARLLLPLGIVAGFLLSLLVSACLGSFLAFVEAMVNGERVTLEDVSASFARHLWDIVGISFVLWIFWTIVTPALLSMPNGSVVVAAVHLVILVLLNAVPELIYLGQHGSLELVTASYGFVAENWIEWFPPTLLLVVGFWLLVEVPLAGPYLLTALPSGLTLDVLLDFPGGFLSAVHAVGIALYAYFAMTFRGLLFRELAGSTRRSRAFRHRMGQ